MTPQIGLKVLKNNYELIRKMDVYAEVQAFEAWLAIDDYQNEYLVKLWPYFTDEPPDVQRALWDLELRNMYRISSSPGAEESLLTIKDVGLDLQAKCFVMVLNSSINGYDNLANAIKNRSKYSWLSRRDTQSRANLWKGLRNIAQAINLLHIQATLHRNVTIENVFFHQDSSPSTFRLSGFEWSIRIGEQQINSPSSGWATPPEIANLETFGYQQEMDWYGFGVLSARCLVNLEVLDNTERVGDRYKRIVKKIEGAPLISLSELEKEIVLRLIDRSADDRLTRDSEILKSIDNLLHSFEGSEASQTENPLLLIYNPQSIKLSDHARDAGFVPDPKDSTSDFNPYDQIHVNYLDAFIQKDLTDAIVYHVSEKTFVLVGKKMSFGITRYRKSDGELTWDAGYIIDTWNLRNNAGGTEERELPPNSIKVRTSHELRTDQSLMAMAQNWERYLPFEDRSAELRANLSNLHDFINCTNQLELLMRDAEIFAFEQLDYKVEDQVEKLVIKEVERTRPVFEVLKLDGGLVEFLQREIELNAGRKENSLVVLTSEGVGTLEIKRQEQRNFFYVESIDNENKQITLQRTAVANISVPPPEKGWLRTVGIFGQFDLFLRRKEAISKLANHSYLLRSLVAPGQVFINTGEIKLPYPLPTDKVDEAKQAVMEDVLTTRPIYTLQGPPGTGKTTMVAYLLRQIFTEDPVAQVLITAQAHGAVDVLRSKVQNDAFYDIDPKNRPLAIRLARSEQNQGSEMRDIPEGSVEFVAIQILELSMERLRNNENLSSLQQEWLLHAKNMRDAIRTITKKESTPEFCELVKRGANITYSTTTGGGLEELARSLQSYDWSIIEEAGKCHGFELALPLQAGHRWLLIGDQFQLPAYRLKDFYEVIDDLDNAVDALTNLPDRTNILDFEWISKWREYDDVKKKNFKDFCKSWLRTFETIFNHCKTAPGSEKITIEKPIGAAAGMLSRQYRMHPTIGSLISISYYDGRIKNLTINADETPLERVIAPIAFPVIQSNGRPVGILWINTPPAWNDKNSEERGPKQGESRYTNILEAETIKSFLNKITLESVYLQKIEQGIQKPLKLAVLSPYNQQVSLLRRKLRGFQFPVGIEPKEALRAKSNTDGLLRFIHTVDSFQGNEADIILVSLVRNNEKNETTTALGFLREPERTNVLLSRAQRLLVLVGSWEFFRNQMDKIPFEDKTRDEWKLKKAMSLLEQWFQSGEATIIDWTELIAEDKE